VDIEGGERGFIHISKISKNYVKRIEDYLHEGQEISAKVIGRARNGGWELSLKDLEEETPKTGEKSEEKKNMDFEKKLSRFLKESSQKLSEYKKRLEKKGRRSAW
jgi:S1 RNA binding domain protein